MKILNNNNAEDHLCNHLKISVIQVLFQFYCRAIAEHFADAAHDLCCIVADTDDAIGAELFCVSNHEFISVLPRFFAQLRVYRDVAAEDGLQSRRERTDDRARANDNAAHDAKMF